MMQGRFGTPDPPENTFRRTLAASAGVGPGGGYRGCHGPRHLADDARRIRNWTGAGRDVYVYYNNDIDGHAVDNARSLIETVGA